jgi:hypothetical protein
MAGRGVGGLGYGAETGRDGQAKVEAGPSTLASPSGNSEIWLRHSFQKTASYFKINLYNVL